MVRELVVHRLLVVEHLVFRARAIGRRFAQGDTIDNAAVSAVTDLLFERKVEIAENPRRHQVAGFARVHERALLRGPRGTRRIGPEPPPARKRLTVEQQPPTCALFRRRQGVGLGGKRRYREETANERKERRVGLHHFLSRRFAQKIEPDKSPGPILLCLLNLFGYWVDLK